MFINVRKNSCYSSNEENALPYRPYRYFGRHHPSHGSHEAVTESSAPLVVRCQRVKRSATRSNQIQFSQTTAKQIEDHLSTTKTTNNIQSSPQVLPLAFLLRAGYNVFLQ